MKDPDQLAEKLISRGLRPSTPRKAILGYLQGSGEHPTPYQMLDAFKSTGSPISIATLYQNLQALSEAGLIRKFVDTDGSVRYDCNTDLHHHLHCTRCGRIQDIDLSSSDLAALQGVGSGLGWQVTGVQLELEGICGSCQAQQN